jgi:hypothetical protein
MEAPLVRWPQSLMTAECIGMCVQNVPAGKVIILGGYSIGHSTHILCGFEAIAYLRFRHMGQFFMEPSDKYDAPINKVLHFIRSVGLIKG